MTESEKKVDEEAERNAKAFLGVLVSICLLCGTCMVVALTISLFRWAIQ